MQAKHYPQHASEKVFICGHNCPNINSLSDEIDFLC